MTLFLKVVKELVELAEEKPTTAFVLSLIAGVLILIGGAMGITFLGMMGGMFGGWSGMMGGYGMMGFPWWGLGMAFGIAGLVIGALVIIAAVMLDSRPAEHRMWGTVILVLSILSIFGGMAGFGIGFILGIIGGALAISWTPQIRPTLPQQPSRFCTQCGQAVPTDAKYCPHCGKEQPT